MRRIPLIAGATLALGLMSSPVLGEAYLTFKGVDQGFNCRVEFNADGVGGYEKGLNTAAGRFKWKAYADGTDESSFIKKDDIIYTFCAEIGESIGSGWSTEYYDTYDPTQLPLDDTGWLGSTISKTRTVNLLANLYEVYFQVASKQGYHGTLTYSERVLAAAFQMASWEIQYESESVVGALTLDVTSGRFRVINTNNDARSMANTLLATLSESWTPDGWLLGFFRGKDSEYPDGRQDQWFYPVPLPAPMLLAGAGLFGVFVGRRKLAKIAG